MTRASTALPRAAERLEDLHVPGAIVQPLRRLAERCRRLPGGEQLLSGAPVGHPAHPFLVSAPVGAWTGAALLDLLGGSPRAARRLVGVGVVLAAPTAVTGLNDWLDTDGAEQQVGALHAVTNAGATALYAASWVLRRRRRPAAGVAVGVAAGLVASAGGWLGGHLAYGMGVGVDTNAFATGPQEWAGVECATLPVAGEAVLGVAGGTRLAVTELDGGPVAVADRCSHRGGPLSEGTMRDGCFTCPWHDSRFDARTGAVRGGPASVPQPVYAVRHRDGRLEARRSERRALRKNPV